MSYIPNSLQRELHFETRSPTLCYHHLLEEISQLSPSLMKKLCQTCVTEMDVVLEEKLFKAKARDVEATFPNHGTIISLEGKKERSPTQSRRAHSVGTIKG